VAAAIGVSYRIDSAPGERLPAKKRLPHRGVTRF
jgi:hypothetical protein